MMGLLKVRVLRGKNLVVRDVRTSDPYVVIKMGDQVPPLPFSFALSHPSLSLSLDLSLNLSLYLRIHL